MTTLNERNNLKLKVNVYKEMVEPVLFIIDGNKRIQVSYSSGELENDLNEFMINLEFMKSINGANELLNEVVKFTDNIGPHVRITLKENQSDIVRNLYKRIKGN